MQNNDISNTYISCDFYFYLKLNMVTIFFLSFHSAQFNSEIELQLELTEEENDVLLSDS